MGCTFSVNGSACVCCWTNGQNTKSQQKMLNTVHANIHNHNLDNLRSILRRGWDVNETLLVPAYEHHELGLRLCNRHRTALHEAARCGWTDGVKMLLEAGATYKMFDVTENPLTLALDNCDCPADLIELLLTHGVDPNDHGHTNIPLLYATSMCKFNQKGAEIVQLLLEHGADPNVTGGDKCPLSIALGQPYEVFSVLLKTLVHFGAEINYTMAGRLPLLHRILNKTTCSDTWNKMFLQALDLFFQHGGNISMVGGEYGTGLQHVVMNGGLSNSVRWLIRHGADTSVVNITLFKQHFFPESNFLTIALDTPLILLQAGMRISYGAQTQLSNLEMAITMWLQKERNRFSRSQTMWPELEKVDYKEGQAMQHDFRKSTFPEYWIQQMVHLQEVNEESLHVYPEKDRSMLRRAQIIWAELEKVEKKEGQRMQYNFRRLTFSEYWSRQMVDLQEFSDESLHVYPENSYISHTDDMRGKWAIILNQIHSMLEFLSQPQPLQWYCRRCVRENLVSLQPSVVKTLPVPAKLKCYILCHEI